MEESTTIDETAARRAKEAMSFDSYRAGSATQEYRQEVEEFRATCESRKTHIPAAFHAELDSLADRYAVKLASYINGYNSRSSQIISPMICGPANYPSARMQKRSEGLFAWERQQENDLEAMRRKVWSIGKSISSTRTDATALLEQKLEGLEAYQERMKNENATARKEGKEKPHPAWELSNNNANIHRVKQRIEEIKTSQDITLNETGTTPEGTDWTATVTDMMLRLDFDNRPELAVTETLKHNGFHWSPKEQVWQRKATENALHSFRRIHTVLTACGSSHASR